jgi:hypothetical protein
MCQQLDHNPLVDGLLTPHAYLGVKHQMKAGCKMGNVSKDKIITVKCTHPGGRSDIYDIEPGKGLIADEAGTIEVIKETPIV